MQTVWLAAQGKRKNQINYRGGGRRVRVRVVRARMADG